MKNKGAAGTTKTKNKKRWKRILVDSRANMTAIADLEFLTDIQNRIELTMRTATGDPNHTTGHGKLKFYTQTTTGEDFTLENIGEGYTLKNLTNSLLSCSQLSDHGFTSVFGPAGDYIMTPGGGRI